MLGLLIAGCGGDAGTPGKDFHCGASDRTGTYLVHGTERSGGTCGPLTDTVVRLSTTPMTMPGVTCSYSQPTSVTDNGCKISSSIHCDADDGSSSDATSVLTQRDSSGDTLTGIYSVTATKNGQSCSSSYDVRYTRQ